MLPMTEGENSSIVSFNTYNLSRKLDFEVSQSLSVANTQS